MSAAFGPIVERIVGAQVYFAIDGAVIGLVNATPTAISALVAPDTPGDSMLDYNLGRVSSVKYTPKTKERTREWGSANGGYKERTDKVIVSDAFEFTCVDFAPKLYDQLMFGTASLAAAGSQTAFASAARHKNGWLYLNRINEAGTVIGILLAHVRLAISPGVEDKNEPGAPVWRVTRLGDSALDTITFATFASAV